MVWLGIAWCAQIYRSLNWPIGSIKLGFGTERFGQVSSGGVSLGKDKLIAL